MGSIVTETMVRSDSEILQSKKLHPFFSKAPQDTLSPHVQSSHEAVDEDSASIGSDNNGDSHKKRRNGNNSILLDEHAPKKQRQGEITTPSGENTIPTHLNTSPAFELTTSQLPQTTNHISTPPFTNNASSSVDLDFQTRLPIKAVVPTDVATKPEDTPTKRPTKVLKFDPKTGTFGLPLNPKEDKASRIVTIKYGQDDTHREAIGNKITQVLNEKPLGKRRGRKPRSAGHFDEVDKVETKPLQAFFPSKTRRKRKETESQPRTDTLRTKSPPPHRHTIFMSTPVSPRKARHLLSNAQPSVQWGNNKPIGTKVPGAMHPAWPSLDTAHIRGNDSCCLPQVKLSQVNGSWAPRKLKGQITALTVQDSVLNSVIQRLDLLSIYETLRKDESHIETAPAQLRKPTRLFETGPHVQRRMTRELQSKVALALGEDDSDDELKGSDRNKIHPAIFRLYQDLETRLSAFDCSTCEGSSWAQKYAPTTAGQILQTGKEAFLLKEWLEALQIQSVDKGTSDGSTKTKGKSERAAKKRRKKRLDTFIVDSDESDDMEEVSENEEDWTPARPGLQKKSIVRRLPAKSPSRLANSMIVSGPHGSGKTAAVYAVAKELDFEIFEINSGNRRSGKDILEKVGDMTRNHLVQHHQSEAVITEPEEEDEVTKNIKSGKQGTMTAFFKPNSGVAPKTLLNIPKKKDAATDEDQKLAHKTQKQSLILLEEVDVLYDEDKQFWTTLIGLMAQSRRPFILTCNDESLVPMQALHLHGILRFSAPPTSLAVDACLLMAANEGHALQRRAVETLYTSRGHDLRAAITELNYWCQIGVGDRRGGFDWFYLRWPKGSDRDENGHVVRVISQDTYTQGMGWLGRDLLCTSSNMLESEEEAMRQCWDSWRTLIGDWPSSLHLSPCMTTPAQPVSSQKHISLDAYQHLLDSLSDSDMLSGGAFCASIHQDLIDPTVPELPSKVKEDYTLGQQLLEATLLSSPAQLGASFSVSVSSLARQEMLDYASRSSNDDACSVFSPIGEGKATSILESSFRSTPHDGLTRRDLSFAFDPVAVSEGSALLSSLEPSVFDRTMAIIVNDVAPWVRSIVSYDQSLMLDRRKLSNLLSEGGQRKRMRNTRSAYSALEGGERKTTRRDNYFRGEMNAKAILDTGLKAWRDAARELDSSTEEGGPRRGGSPDSGSAEDIGFSGSP